MWEGPGVSATGALYAPSAMAPDTRTITLVPRLIGKGSHMAAPLLREARLSLGVIRFVASSQVTAGVVMDQYPREGRPVASGTPVDLTVASGEFQ